MPIFIGISWLLVIEAFATAKAYDGIWFLGFNLKSPVLKNVKVRTAINQALDRSAIITKVDTTESLPLSIIPPTMLGYDPDLKAHSYDLKTAKTLMQQALLPINDQRLKSLTLLHTDGLKTIAVAKQIQNDLRAIGIKIKIKQISYKLQEQWEKELALGQHDFFLMGYKAGLKTLFTSEASASFDSYDLVEPLFASQGEANFTNYSSAKVDQLLGQLRGINLALKSERHKKLKKINQILYKDLPVIVLFYIEKL